MWTQYLALRNKSTEHLLSAMNREDSVEILKQQEGTQAQGISPPNIMP